MQDESKEDPVLFLRHPHHLPSASGQSLAYYLLVLSIPQKFIMSHGEAQLDQSTTTFEIINGSERGEEPAAIVVTDDDSAAQEEKKRVFERVEREMEVFRKGECTRFKASTRIASELDNWAGATDKERGKAFDSCLAEINSFLAIQDEVQRSVTRETPPVEANLSTERQSRRKRIREEAEELLNQVLSAGEESEGEEVQQRVVRKRAKEEEMPWYKSTASSSRRGSCIETCKTLLRFSEDLPGVKSLLRVADKLPEGIPSTQWDRILRGESVDLHQVLSAMHFIQFDEERKGRVGGTEVIFAVAESKRQVRTGGEWSSAYRRMSKAVEFLFPHRREELSEYTEHIEGLFSAKHANAHSKVILYDQSVRNRVGGGQNVLLTDYQLFNGLSEAILHADGIEYRGSGKGLSKGGKGSAKGGPSKKEACRRFNGQDGCKFTEEECFYKHTCTKCGKQGHGKASCTSEKH